ncbi:MAG: DUF411 domain-containing protein [Candidatus Methylomirabilaceae bacterium]
MSRTGMLRIAGAVTLVVAGLTAAALLRHPVPAGPVVTVYKSPTCGCCTKWIEHLRAAGFTVEAHDTDDLASVMANFGVPSSLGSCHTGEVGGYVIEGHVPADLIKKALAEHPAILGLAVPGMPIGSPGMEGSRAERYNVIAFDRQGKTSVYARR